MKNGIKEISHQAKDATIITRKTLEGLLKGVGNGINKGGSLGMDIGAYPGKITEDFAGNLCSKMGSVGFIPFFSSYLVTSCVEAVGGISGTVLGAATGGLLGASGLKDGYKEGQEIVNQRKLGRGKDGSGIPSTQPPSKLLGNENKYKELTK